MAAHHVGIIEHWKMSNTVCRMLHLHTVTSTCTGTRLGMVLNGLAAAYRGEQISPFLPKPLLQRCLWPWHLAEHLTEHQREDLDYPAADSQEALKMQQSQVRGSYSIEFKHLLDCMRLLATSR